MRIDFKSKACIPSLKNVNEHHFRKMDRWYIASRMTERRAGHNLFIKDPGIGALLDDGKED